MTPPSRISDLVRAVSRVSPRPRLIHAPRRLHQAVARVPPSHPAPVSGPANDDYLHALYEDLMVLESPTAWASQPSTELQTETLDAPSKTVDALLAEYARQGNTRDFELSLSRALSEPPTEHQRDLHVKAHIVHSSLSTPSSSRSTSQQFPTSALTVLHQYEASGHFAPIKSYTRVISALFNVETSPSSDPRLGRAAAQTQAWDLFAHMRYVAHPVPDAHLYALMIRACGSSTRPEPERALDLWTEMQENSVKPIKGAYEAVIRVCGRAGPEWLGEGMRLAREMSDQHPISGANGRGLWCALLEGCKRAGDLKKARWILAEAVRGSGDGGALMVDSELMTHVFHTYASYKPPFRRETTRLLDRSVPLDGEVATNESPAEEMTSHSDAPSQVPPEQTQASDGASDIPVESMEALPSFSRLPPQTPSDVISETQALFHRILQDRSLSSEAHPFSQDGLLAGTFAHVELTPVLLNAYLSVFYRHASIETSQEAFDFLFNDSSGTQLCRPDEYIYINALERCAIARAEDRHVAARWAKNVWRRWEVVEAQGLGAGKGTVGSFSRLIEKAHAAMRKVLVLSGDVDGAVALLRSFVSRYPPNAVLQPVDSPLVSLDASPMTTPVASPSKPAIVRLFAKPPILSTRTVLTNPVPSAARPLVRLTSAVTPQDDRIPPVIGFSDVDLLHTRLAEHGRVKELGYIKWVCMAYAGALKKRRDVVMKAAPARHEDEVD